MNVSRNTSKGEERKRKEEPEGAGGRPRRQLTERGEALFEKAADSARGDYREEKVPPYICYSDKTLVPCAW